MTFYIYILYENIYAKLVNIESDSNTTYVIQVLQLKLRLFLKELYLIIYIMNISYFKKCIIILIKFSYANICGVSTTKK